MRRTETSIDPSEVHTSAGAASRRRLSGRLGYTFADPELLERALTHRSATGYNNERLEFLGDAVIELLVTEWLYDGLPDASEGRLTRLRARFVRRETLAELAREIELGESLRLGGGELKAGGRHRSSILADAFEALLGALYLDAGLQACREVLVRLLEPRLELACAETSKDPKTRLQERLQAEGSTLPVYEVVSTEGAAHQRHFVVACRIDGVAEVVRGSGSSRRRAEQAAAERALQQLDDG